MSDTYRVLIVDDDPAQAEMVTEFLRVSGFKSVDWANSIRKMWEFLQERSFDIVLLDYRLPDGTGLDALAQMQQRGVQTPVVMVTGQGTERIAVQAIQHGAADYLLKSSDYLITLPSLIRKAVQSHQLQLSVQRSLEQIRYQATLLNNVRDAIVVWDMSGRITYWNPAADSLFGWSAEERLDKMVEESYLSTFTPPVALPQEGDTTGQHVVRRYRRPNGKVIWVSSRLTALHDSGANNRLIGYMDVSHDITRRVEAEQALRDSEARYRAIVEDYQTELICRFKPNGTLTFVNEVFCRYFNRPRAELVGANLFSFLPENEHPRLSQHLAGFGTEYSFATLEHQVILSNREIRWLQRTDRAIFDAHGAIFEFQSMGRDISEHKRMQAQIQTAQAHLVQAARLAMIGEMAAGFAHQVYNPLTTIIADAQLLLRQLPPDQDGQISPARESAQAIEQAGWRLQQVLQRLMEFSRPTSDTLAFVDVNQTIHSAVNLVGAQIEAISCNLDMQLADQLPSVYGNAHQLEDLWVNLLLLARDASNDGTNHTIGVSSKLDTEQGVVIEVRDNGRPIPAGELGTIFEPNFVGPTIGRGTGMELSICREIVRQYNGQIMVESLPERDTIFRVVLPVASLAATESVGGKSWNQSAS